MACVLSVHRHQVVSAHFHYALRHHCVAVVALRLSESRINIWSFERVHHKMVAIKQFYFFTVLFLCPLSMPKVCHCWWLFRVQSIRGRLLRRTTVWSSWQWPWSICSSWSHISPWNSNWHFRHSHPKRKPSPQSLPPRESTWKKTHNNVHFWVRKKTSSKEGRNKTSGCR